jgi:hypothetical protein
MSRVTSDVILAKSGTPYARPPAHTAVFNL